MLMGIIAGATGGTDYLNRVYFSLLFIKLCLKFFDKKIKLKKKKMKMPEKNSKIFFLENFNQSPVCSILICVNFP